MMNNYQKAYREVIEVIENIFQEMFEKEKEWEKERITVYKDWKEAKEKELGTELDETEIMRPWERHSVIYVIKELRNIKEIREYIGNNYDYLLEQIHPSYRMQLEKVMNGIEIVEEVKKEGTQETQVKEPVAEKQEDEMEGNIGKAISRLTGFSEPELREAEVYLFLEGILKRVLENEGVEVGDIKYLDEGRYSKVYKIGDKIVKMSAEDRETNQIPYNRRTIESMIRMPIPNLKQEDKTLLFIEMMEEVEIGNITDEEVYQAYKDYREDGQIWLDPKKDNIGRLKKDNIRIDPKEYFAGIPEVVPFNTGIIGEIKEGQDILKTGEVAVIDTDYIYKEEDKKASEYVYKYEMRYRIEEYLSRYVSKQFSTNDIGKATLTGEKAVEGIQAQNADLQIKKDLDSLERPNLEGVSLDDK